MQATVIFTGLGCGALLTVAGLVLWGEPRRAAGLSQAVRAIGWLAGAFLLIGALLAWLAYDAPANGSPGLILVAALAAPPAARRREPFRGRLVPTLLAFLLAGLSFAWLLAPNGVGPRQGPSISVSLATICSWIIVVCAGLGARSLGGALGEVITPRSDAEEPFSNRVNGLLNVTYALLTLVVGSTALANLWQRGLVWETTPSASRLAGAWLAWSAAWSSPRRVPWLRAGLTTVAALALLWAALAGI